MWDIDLVYVWPFNMLTDSLGNYFVFNIDKDLHKKKKQDSAKDGSNSSSRRAAKERVIQILY